MEYLNNFIVDKIKFYYFFINFSFRKHRVKNLYAFMNFFKFKKIFEIGGPSRFFMKNVPLYQITDNIDGSNFSDKTLRDGKIISGFKKYNFYKKKFGYQYILDAINLKSIQDESYDSLISSNCLEHIANPLKALQEWKRVIKKNGFIFLVLPNPLNTFDRNRKITDFEHILKDFKNETKEDDMTHFNEIVNSNAYIVDQIIGSKEDFVKFAKENYKYRIMHHHVFDKNLVSQIADFLNMELVYYGSIKKDNYFLIKKI